MNLKSVSEFEGWPMSHQILYYDPDVRQQL